MSRNTTFDELTSKGSKTNPNNNLMINRLKSLPRQQPVRPVPQLVQVGPNVGKSKAQVHHTGMINFIKHVMKKIF